MAMLTIRKIAPQNPISAGHFCWNVAEPLYKNLPATNRSA